MNKRGLPPAAVADTDGRGERAYKSGGFLYRRCRDPCSKAKAIKRNNFFWSGKGYYHETTYTTQKTGRACL